MAASAADILRLRRMISELTNQTYNDETLHLYLEAWPLVDADGKEAGTDGWVEAYDLHAAAAELWEEKAASLSPKHNYSADGATYSSNQMYENAIEQARYHGARAKAKTKKVFKKPDELSGSDLDVRIYANIDPIDEEGMDLWKDLLL